MQEDYSMFALGGASQLDGAAAGLNNALGVAANAYITTASSTFNPALHDPETWGPNVTANPAPTAALLQDLCDRLCFRAQLFIAERNDGYAPARGEARAHALHAPITSAGGASMLATVAFFDVCTSESSSPNSLSSGASCRPSSPQTCARSLSLRSSLEHQKMSSRVRKWSEAETRETLTYPMFSIILLFSSFSSFVKKKLENLIFPPKKIKIYLKK
jgi:hypothetical protein